MALCRADKILCLKEPFDIREAFYIKEPFYVNVTPNLSPLRSFVSKNALVQLTVDLISSIKTSVWIKMTKEQHVKLENITSWLDRNILKNGLLHQVVCL